MASESGDRLESGASELNEMAILGRPETRRASIRQVAGTSVAIAIGPNLLGAATKKSIVASRYADTLGVPALFDRSLFDQLLSLGNEAGAKSIILRNRECVAQLSFPEGAIDIDAWEDLEKLNESDRTERSEEQVAGSGSQALSVRIIS